MKSVAALCLAAIAAAGCNIMGVQGSGVSKTEARKVGGFDKIQVQGSGEVTVTVGGPLSVEVTSDDNLLELIQTVVQDGTLIIKPTRSISTRIGINVKVTVPSLTAASINGSGDFDITGLKGERFDVSISGSGDVRADGQVQYLDAAVSGSGDMDLLKLQARQADASIAGSGDIRLNVSDAIDASISGSGSITYVGDPNVSKSISGSGDVSKR